MLVLIIFALLLTGCSDNKAAPVNRQAQAAPVYISKAILKSVPIEIETVGNVEAYSTVLVKAQIGGELMIVDFTEGADVHKGDRLFVIDPRPYESQVAQAEATLAKDKAQFQAAQQNPFGQTGLPLRACRPILPPIKRRWTARSYSWSTARSARPSMDERDT